MISNNQDKKKNTKQTLNFQDDILAIVKVVHDQMDK